jgi:hypothetical protein
MDLQNSELFLKAVKKNGRALEYIKQQTLEICLAAVQHNGDALRYVDEKTPELAVRQKID